MCGSRWTPWQQRAVTAEAEHGQGDEGFGRVEAEGSAGEQTDAGVGHRAALVAHGLVSVEPRLIAARAGRLLLVPVEQVSALTRPIYTSLSSSWTT